MLSEEHNFPLENPSRQKICMNSAALRRFSRRELPEAIFQNPFPNFFQIVRTHSQGDVSLEV